MRVHGRKEAVLNALTALVAVAAAFMLVNDRVLPALAERTNVSEGESVGDPLLLRGMDGADTIRIGADDTAVLVLFQSTCPVCERTAPDWAGLAAAAPGRLFAIGLEADADALEWRERELSGVRLVSPFDRSAFLERFRIRAVPTTLLFVRGRLLMHRIGPLLPEDLARIGRALGESRPRGAAGAPFHPTGRRI
ncbi:MAG: TlpA family protein disulfide reductase [Gemmatimonadota bacterium]